MIVWPSKSPLEVKDYQNDYLPELTAGDAIFSSAWSPTSSPPGLAMSGSIFSGSIVKIMLSGGVIDTVYTLTNTITTTPTGDTIIQTFQILVEAR